MTCMPHAWSVDHSLSLIFYFLEDSMLLWKVLISSTSYGSSRTLSFYMVCAQSRRINTLLYLGFYLSSLHCVYHSVISLYRSNSRTILKPLFD